MGASSAEGYKLNNPMLAFAVAKQAGTLKSEYSFVETDKENIFVESVKGAENDDSIIIRLYDAFGICSVPKISFGFEIKEAYIADMCEKEIEKLEVKGNKLALSVKPFEIVTLKITR